MIKKTFLTLVKKPILLGFMVLIFAYNQAVMYTSGFVSRLVFQMFSHTNAILNYGMILQLFYIIRLIVSTMFIYGPMFYLMYAYASGEDKTGWYKKGLKQNWWRVFAVLYILSLVQSLLTPRNLFAWDDSFHRYMITSFILSSIFGYFIYLSIAPLTAEKNFWRGYANILHLGKKYFWKLLIVFMLYQAFTYAVPGLRDAMYAFNPQDGAYFWASVLRAVIPVVFYLYSMNLYMNEKQKAERKIEAETNDEVEADD